MLQDALKVSLVFSSVPPILRADMLLRVIFERYFVCVTFLWLHAMTAMEQSSHLSCSMSQICKHLGCIPVDP